jgi:hypothetical protein
MSSTSARHVGRRDAERMPDVAPWLTVTGRGTVTALLELDSITAAPPAGADPRTA